MCTLLETLIPSCFWLAKKVAANLWAHDVPGVPKKVRLHAELPSCKRTFYWDTLYFPLSFVSIKSVSRVANVITYMFSPTCAWLTIPMMIGRREQVKVPIRNCLQLFRLEFLQAFRPVTAKVVIFHILNAF